MIQILPDFGTGTNIAQLFRTDIAIYLDIDNI